MTTIPAMIEVMGESYVAICKCGEMVAAVVDNPYRRPGTAKLVAQWIKAGYTVEHVHNDEVRVRLSRCTCPKQEQMF